MGEKAIAHEPVATTSAVTSGDASKAAAVATAATGAGTEAQSSEPVLAV